MSALVEEHFVFFLQDKANRLRIDSARSTTTSGSGHPTSSASAAEITSQYGLDNLCATVDVSRLGQSEPRIWQHDLARQEARGAGFGWRVLQVDGHDVSALIQAYEDAAQAGDRPTVILARTIKGKGIHQPVARSARPDGWWRCSPCCRTPASHWACSCSPAAPNHSSGSRSATPSPRSSRQS